MNILLAAEEGAGIRALKLLLASRHRVTGVLTASPACAKAAGDAGLAVWPAARIKDAAFADEVRAMNADVLLNVHSLYVVRAAVLEALRFGGFNLHPGPLPDYAGMNAPSWAIFHGEPRHGVTLHWMSAGIDEGDIAYQEMFELAPEETGLSAGVKCVSIGMKLVERLLAALDSAEVPRQPQDLTRRRYFGRQTPFNGRAGAELAARELERLVRASDYHPFPSPWGAPCCRIGDREVGLLKVALTGERADAPPGSIRLAGEQVWLALRDEWLAVRKVMVDGRAGDARAVLGAGGSCWT
jgi:UDP-4-amino-4-deoxy-L-arabinose formyltransferase/UDP-glucuronic acid dehydrogenase (UDP-4-keto-hexauronic acid decarboxylating)